MLKRLYVDNFRCLEDFELNFDSINLFLGDNGVGKSTVFDILEKLQAIITTNITVSSTLKLSDYTRWKDIYLSYGNSEYLEDIKNGEQAQSFELKIEGNDGVYRYQLKVDFRDTNVSRDIFVIDIDNLVFDDSKHDEFYETFMVSECLWFNEEIILNVYQQKVEIFLDDGSPNNSSRYNYSQSIIPLLKSNNDNKKIIWFRERMRRLVILKISPNLITSESSQKNLFLSKQIENYVF